LKLGDALRRHLVEYCGEGAEALSFAGSDIVIQRFQNVPGEDMSFYITTGLSAAVLRQGEGSDIRHELCMTVAMTNIVSVPEVLVATATVIADDRRALRYGQVIGPFEGMFPELPSNRCKFLYCSVPAMMPEGFSIVRSASPPVIIAELYPITDEERLAIESSGTDAFETLVESGQIDLLDLERH
jgi:hypothetical protein